VSDKVTVVVANLLLWVPLFVVVPVSQVNAEPPIIEAAGCLIPTPKGIVMGVNRVLGKIQLPMGRHVTGEDPQKTAARETLEETGITVDVGALILTLDNNQVYLFLCAPRTPITDYSTLQAKDTWEVSKVIVLDPHTMRNVDGTIVANDWRFPETRAFLKALFPSGEKVNGAGIQR
jgi:8-oxo-dGTP pyrophosphatase MutT (NUDIX family)